jgi:hypothetical protein
MYVAWGPPPRHARRVARGHGHGGQLLAISGLGCWRLLAPGVGPARQRGSRRPVTARGRPSARTARVRVAPREPGPRIEGPALAESAAVRSTTRRPRATSSAATGPDRRPSSVTRRAGTARDISTVCSPVTSTSAELTPGRQRSRKPSPSGSSGSSSSSARPVPDRRSPRPR